jgi:hypothetical protein
VGLLLPFTSQSAGHVRRLPSVRITKKARKLSSLAVDQWEHQSLDVKDDVSNWKLTVQNGKVWKQNVWEAKG